jgi:hypothetical protein
MNKPLELQIQKKETFEMNKIEKNNEKDLVIAKKEVLFQPGEKGFSVFLFLFGSFFAYQSYLMYQKAPGPSSYAAVPLFVSLLIMIFSGLIFIFDFKMSSVNSNSNLTKKIIKSFTYMFPKDVLVMMILIVFYCVALLFDIGFYIITPIFLWLSMCYLMQKHYFKNILWSALSLLFVFAVFSFAFKVVLP